MSKALLIRLCVVSVLVVAIVGIMSLLSEARAQGDGIIVDGANYTSIMNNEYSAQLANSTIEVTSRVVLEYGDFGSKLDLSKSGELSQAASAVSSRVVVEYADFAVAYESQKSDVLLQLAAGVTSRVIVEYADFVFCVNLDRDQMISEFPSAMILPLLVTLSTLILAFARGKRKLKL